jgi:pyruvate,water dikinase
MENIVWFKDCSHKDKLLVGGKNASLGELKALSESMDMHVGDGFAITTNVYDEFCKYNNVEETIDTELKGLRVDDIDGINKASEAIKDTFAKGTCPLSLIDEIRENYFKLNEMYGGQIEVAVRSSAIAEDMPQASFAGQQDTFLNIPNVVKLLDAVILCFASLYNPRAISYRMTHGIDKKDVKLSIGVQQMIRSDLGSAGVAFSLDPNQGYTKAIVINSAFGLGELVVSGGIKPDEYILDKRVLYTAVNPIIGKTIGHKTSKMIYNIEGGVYEVNTREEEQKVYSLTDMQAIALSKYVYQLEKHYSSLYDKPISIDVEWALDGLNEKLYIIQARPETVHSQCNVHKMQQYALQDIPPAPLLTGVAVGSQISTGKVCILDSMDQYTLFKEGDVLVTDMTTPDWEPIMKKSSGIITNKGGKTCHAAIVARELGVNACVGSQLATTTFTQGQSITISCADGDTAKVYEGKLSYVVHSTEVDITKDIPVDLMLNVGSPENCFKASMLPHKGVGLTRIEFIINEYIQVHPLALCDYPNVASNLYTTIADIVGNKTGESYFIQQLSRGVGKIASAFYPEPIIVRLSDFKSNEYRNLLGGDVYEPNEENPMIGWRGASRYYSSEYGRAFQLECKALAYARDIMKMDNIVVMIPFCRSPEECSKVLECMAKYGLERGVKGLKVYLMCEIPSNVIEADRFAPYIDGVSIGGNDLLQLTLGIDRDSEKLQSMTDHTNVSYRRMIKKAIEDYSARGVKVGFCGQQPSDSEEFCAFLVDSGIDTISLTPDSLLSVRKYLENKVI